MPHLRKRHALRLLGKKLAYSPVVTLQGARQTGKSTLARDILKDKHYTTLDQVSVLQQARDHTEVFLEETKLKADGRLLVIDEAQKAGLLFDQIKYLVDLDRKPGQFLLLGSTEFSKEMRIKETLTGRVSRLRIFPMTLGESLQLPFQELDARGLPRHGERATRPELVKYLQHGGYPGIFATRSAEERRQRWEDLVTITCERDALLFPQMKGDPDVCRRILMATAALDEPSFSAISKAVKAAPKKVMTQMKILGQLFMLHAINPHPLGTGKTLYYLNDSGLAAHLGASFERRLEISLYLELLAGRAYSPKSFPALYYYRTSKGTRVHAITEESPRRLHACRIISDERQDMRQLEVLLALRKRGKDRGIDVSLSTLGPIGGTLKKEKISMQPWESLA